MSKIQRPCRNSRGNILFLILLAVVLFAALSYAVTAAMRGGEGKSAGSESAELAAAEILQWFAAVDNAVMRMHLVGGIAYEDMSFGYDAARFDGTALPNYMHNTRCTSDNCRIFKSAGGGVAPPDFNKYSTPIPTGWIDTSLDAGLMYSNMQQWPGAGSDKNDVVLYIHGIKPEVCAAFNRQIGLTAIPGRTGTHVSGNFVSQWDAAAQTFTSNVNAIYGKDSFANGNSGSGSGLFCYIWHVVIKR